MGPYWKDKEHMAMMVMHDGPTALSTFDILKNNLVNIIDWNYFATNLFTLYEQVYIFMTRQNVFIQNFCEEKILFSSNDHKHPVMVDAHVKGRCMPWYDKERHECMDCLERT